MYAYLQIPFFLVKDQHSFIKKDNSHRSMQIGNDDNANYFQQVASEGEGYPYGPFFK